ncbi:transport permease protein [Longispora fulva]|uniref:Transport permease protein n=1 Tax=Longispora fulva TaxID=619741 RepID=A0A8J7KMD3_9ACTN|nr:ABC transporter permease [Longispora fulva]MBG6140344.1 ABC-2 type transport system permease protein [Longispora fulva]GIG57275.1 transport permease protein [Longispora fulva]
MKLLRDTWLVFARQMALLLRNPVWVIVGIMQPLYFLYLFGPLLTKALQAQLPPGAPESATYQFFIPGLLIQLAMFGSMFVGFALVAELRQGVIERMRVTPVSRLALLLGRSGRDIVMLLFQSLVIVLLALPLGLKVELGNLALALGLLALIGLLMSSFSYAIALILRSEDALAPLLNTISMPIWLLSGILLPMTFAPGWLSTISKFIPFKWAADAARQLFAGNPGDPAVWKGLVSVAVPTLLCVIWASRKFAKSVR